ncbi:hypothetical protein [Priestia flexa]|uniref:hypothetical protein n=1 Tax=Priestia flexa TaxID=86664 RepID=UPI00099C9962|nr:hypothetical protein [Priestia flexa]AQX56047.1 hypothetical protein BC359_18205 [Priestia flexa]
MTKDKSAILQRIKALNEEKEVNAINKRLAELHNRLYEMDVDSMEYDVKHGYKTREEADNELIRRRKKYFDQGGL